MERTFSIRGFAHAVAAFIGVVAGKVVSIFVLFTGVAIFLYVAGAIVEMIARGIFTGAWADRRRRRMIGTIRDHYIICGDGRVGRPYAVRPESRCRPRSAELRAPDELFAVREAVAD